MTTGIVLVVLLVLAVSANDEILSLPGIGPVNFKQYAGYINVNKVTGRNLFYWFTESQKDPTNDPVVLWLNGGPGCSSLGGFFEELGPFIPRPAAKGNITLEINPFSWNNVANMIFLDSPSGVGFSYSTDVSDYTVGDYRTANDTYNFLLQFFQLYPQFAKNPFWITGESYAGHYVPTLAHRIVLGNAQNVQKINFKGFMVGNPWTDVRYDSYGAAFDWWTHSLISDQTWTGLEDTCDFRHRIVPSSHPDPEACAKYQTDAFKEMGNINVYDIYEDVCLDVNPAHQLMRYLASSGSGLSTFAKTALDNDPCENFWVTAYLNQPSVKTAIHVLPKIKWEDCSTTALNYSSQDFLTSMLPVYVDLLEYPANISIVVFSGDVDGVVPTIGTRRWIGEVLNLTIAEPWRPWIGSNGQVGGYTVGYEGLTFLTVRGAGHEVPQTQPGRAFDFFKRVLDGNPL